MLNAMAWLLELFRISLYHGAVTGGAMAVGGLLGFLAALVVLYLLHRIWFSLLGGEGQETAVPRAPLTAGQRVGQICHALSWATWLVAVPIVFIWCGASVGSAFAIRGVLEDPRPVDGAVDLALWASERALSPLVPEEEEETSGARVPLAAALSFVDGSDRFRIDAVPERIDAFSDESVRVALEQVDQFLADDSGDSEAAEQADPLARWLAARVVGLLERATVDLAQDRYLEPLLEELRVEAAGQAEPEMTDGPQVVRVLVRRYGQRPFARGFFWGILIQAGTALGLLLAWIVACIFSLLLLRRLSRTPQTMPLR